MGGRLLRLRRPGLLELTSGTRRERVPGPQHDPWRYERWRLSILGDFSRPVTYLVVYSYPLSRSSCIVTSPFVSPSASNYETFFVTFFLFWKVFHSPINQHIWPSEALAVALRSRIMLWTSFPRLKLRKISVCSTPSRTQDVLMNLEKTRLKCSSRDASHSRPVVYHYQLQHNKQQLQPMSY